MNIYARKSFWKLLLLILAAILVGVSLFISHNITKGIAKEEKRKADLIAETFKKMNSVTDDDYRDFLLEIIKNNKSIPVILADSTDHIIAERNVIDTLDKDRTLVDKQYEASVNEILSGRLAEMKLVNDPIVIEVFPGFDNYIYYDNSDLYKKLVWFPYVQFFFLFVFLLIAYFLFSTSRKAEQNQVWVGMSKETAHQLGTPISSMLGWIEYLKSMGDAIDYDTFITEMSKDIKRLEQITERFSKIGSDPDLTPLPIADTVQRTFDYIKKRSSQNVQFSWNAETNIDVRLSAPLFSWVVENIMKNALNAIEGKGKIGISIFHIGQQVIIDISDSGKGIAKSDFKTVFKPGYTTRKRGWGLGLSLTKRIVEDYHKGKVFVKDSTIGKGSTFRIILNI